MCGGASLVVVGGVLAVGAAVGLGGMTFAEGGGLKAIRALRKRKRIHQRLADEKMLATPEKQIDPSPEMRISQHLEALTVVPLAAVEQDVAQDCDAPCEMEASPVIVASLA